MRICQSLPALLLATLAATAGGPAIAGVPQEALHLQREWARINYDVPESERADAMAKLVTSCDDASSSMPSPCSRINSRPKPRSQSANTTRPGKMALTSVPSAASMNMPCHGISVPHRV